MFYLQMALAHLSATLYGLEILKAHFRVLWATAPLTFLGAPLPLEWNTIHLPRRRIGLSIFFYGILNPLFSLLGLRMTLVGRSTFLLASSTPDLR